MSKEMTKPDSIKAPSAFSLVEIIVTVVLISVITVAVGLTLNHTYKRTGNTKVSLSRMRQENDVLKILADDLRWATEITPLPVIEHGLTLGIPSTADTGGLEMVTYWWSPSNMTLSRRRGQEPMSIIASDIYSMIMEPDTFTKESTIYFHGITVILQFGSDTSNTVRRYIKTMNEPTLSSGG